jgi:signal transduction histidine kinase
MLRLQRSAVVKVVFVLIVIAVAALALFAIPASDSPPTYRAASHAAQLLGVGAGLALLVATLATARVAIALPLLALAGLWFGQDLGALNDSAALLRSLAESASPFAAALALHLALALPDGRLPRAGRIAVAVAYLAATVSAVGTLTLRDPFLDVYCWRQCDANPLLVHAEPHVARAFVVGAFVTSLVVGSIGAAVAAGRIVAASPVARRLLAPALIPLGLVAAFEAARGAALLLVPVEDPGRAGFRAIYLLRAAALAALAAGIAWLAVVARVRRARVRRLTAELGAAPAPGKLREALAAALGDPTLDVLYWAPAIGGFVDADAAPRDPPAAGATRITRGDRVLAVVVHERAALDTRELERLLEPAARLAIENEALRAEILTQLGQLRHSRARIVATADESRRRAERDLHDGAQQRLLSVVLDLRLAGSEAHGALRERLAHIGGEVDRAFTELRELAHGIYPAVLTEAGLEAALPTLADTAPLVVRLGDITAERLPAPIEAGAYVTVDEAIRDAAARRASAIDVSATVQGGRLVVTAADDGAPRQASLVHVADRIGAHGGVLELAPTLLRAEMPCA